MTEGNSDSVTASVEGKLCSAGNESLLLLGGSAAHYRGGSGQGQCWRCWDGSELTPATGMRDQVQWEGVRGAGGCRAEIPRSTREAVSAPWKQVCLCGKCFLVISLPWLFVFQACLHTNWHLLPWLIIHPDPISPVWCQHWPMAPDVTTDRASDS